MTVDGSYMESLEIISTICKVLFILTFGFLCNGQFLPLPKTNSDFDRPVSNFHYPDSPHNLQYFVQRAREIDSLIALRRKVDSTRLRNGYERQNQQSHALCLSITLIISNTFDQVWHSWQRTKIFGVSHLSMTPLRIGNYPFWGPESDTCSAKSFQPGSKCKYPGYGPETIGFLCDYLRKPYEIINFPENMPIGGLQPDGQWNGMLGLLENGTVDALSVPWILSEIRQDYFSFTVPTHVFPASYVIGPRQSTTFEVASRIFVTFHWNLSITVFATIFALFASLVAIHYYWAKINDSEKSDEGDSFDLVQRATAKHMRQPKCGTKILVLLYTIVVVLFAGLYKDSLLVYLLIPQKEVRMSEDMIWQMVRGKSLRIIAVEDEYHNSGIWQNIHDGDNSKFKIFKDILATNPPMLVNTLDDVLAIFKTHPPDLVYYNDIVRAAHLTRDVPALSLVDVQDPDQNVYGYIFRKNSSLVEEFDEAIKRNTAFIYSRQNYYIRQRGNGMIRQENNSTHVSPLSIIQLLGAFVLFACGAIIGLVSFLAEKACKVFFRSRVNEKLSKKFEISSNIKSSPNLSLYQHDEDAEDSVFELQFPN